MKGDRVECIINFLEANKFITNFVLAASTKESGSDPLISAFTGKQRAKISVSSDNYSTKPIRRRN